MNPMRRPGAREQHTQKQAPQWAELMRRAFGYGLRACATGQDEPCSVILDPTAAREVLGHLGSPSQLLTAAPARASPQGHTRCKSIDGSAESNRAATSRYAHDLRDTPELAAAHDAVVAPSSAQIVAVSGRPVRSHP